MTSQLHSVIRQLFETVERKDLTAVLALLYGPHGIGGAVLVFTQLARRLRGVRVRFGTGR